MDEEYEDRQCWSRPATLSFRCVFTSNQKYTRIGSASYPAVESLPSQRSNYESGRATAVGGICGIYCNVVGNSQS